MPDIKTIYLIVAFVCIIVVFLVQELVARRKRKVEGELDQVRQVARELMPTSENFVTAYARTTDAAGQEGRCAVSFKPVEAYVIPLRYAGGVLEHGDPVHLTPDDLSRVKVEDGRAELYDLAGDFLFTLEVLAENVRQEPTEPFQIQQKREAKAFRSFLTDLEEQTNIMDV